MSMTKDQIFAEAMVLGPDEREALAEELWLSLNGGQQAAVDAAWLEEVRRRDAAFAAGQDTELTVDEAVATFPWLTLRKREIVPRLSETTNVRSVAPAASIWPNTACSMI